MAADFTPGLTDGSISGDIFHTPNGAAWDASKLIFGDWLELLFNDSGNGSATMITHVAGYMNFLAFILISVIMGYVLIASVIKTASEGKIMGNNWSTVWLPLRTFLACFLIYPIGIGSASNISFIQASVAWLGMVGSNAADNVAGFVVQNLTKKTFSVTPKAQGYQAVMDMTKMAFCTASFNKTMNDSSLYSNKDDIYGFVGGNMVSVSAYANTISGLSESSDMSRIAIGPEGKCGSLSVKIEDDKFKGLGPAIYSNVLKYQKRIYDEVAAPLVLNESLDYNAQTMDTSYRNGNNDAVTQEITTAVNQSSANLKKIVSEYENSMSTIVASQLSKENGPVIFKANGNDIEAVVNTEMFADLGWAYLGTYYTLLSRSIGDVSGSMYITSNISSFDNPDGCSINSGVLQKAWNGITKLWSDDDDKSCPYLDEFNKSNIIVDVANGSIASDGDSSASSKISSVCSKNGCNASSVEGLVANYISEPFFKNDEFFDNTEGYVNSFSRGFIQTLGWGGTKEFGLDYTNDNINNDLTSFNEAQITPSELTIADPITFTSNIGYSIVYAGNIIKSVMRGLEASGKAVSQSLLGQVGGGFLEGLLTSLVEFVMTILLFLIPQGMAMAYFLPLLPSLIWALAFISWLLMFAESIFNSPLAVTLLATPEGEGISGSRMERKIALMAALILKPTMLIIGLLLSMVILNIGFVFLNQVFWMAASKTTMSFDLIAVSALITLWFSIMIAFMHSAFKIIPQFADDALEWFLGGIARPFGNNLDGTTASDFSGASTQNVGSGTLGNSAINTVKNTAGRITKKGGGQTPSS